MVALVVMDWATVFQPQLPLLELIVRGTVSYLALFLLLRVALRRQSSTLGVTDLLVVVLIADAVQNAMVGQSTSVIDGILQVAVILFWSYALDWLGYRFPIVEKLIHPPALPLVKNGKVLRRNLRHELISDDELQAAMREQGIERLDQIKHAYMESDGRISFITHDADQRSAPDDQRDHM